MATETRLLDPNADADLEIEGLPGTLGEVIPPGLDAPRDPPTPLDTPSPLDFLPEV